MKKSAKTALTVVGVLAGGVGLLLLIKSRRAAALGIPAPTLGDLLSPETKAGLAAGEYRVQGIPDVVETTIDTQALGFEGLPSSGGADADVTTTPVIQGPDVSVYARAVEAQPVYGAEKEAALQHFDALGIDAALQGAAQLDAIRRGISKWGMLTEAERNQIMRHWYALYAYQHEAGKARSYDAPVRSRSTPFREFLAAYAPEGPLTFWEFVTHWTPPRATQEPLVMYTQPKTTTYTKVVEPTETTFNLAALMGYSQLRPRVWVRG